MIMPLTDKGSKILANMQSHYGDKKGKSVFYASINAGKIKGAEKRQYGGAAAGLTDESTKEEILQRAREIAERSPIFKSLQRMHERRMERERQYKEEAEARAFGGRMGFKKFGGMKGMKKAGMKMPSFGLHVPRFGKFQHLARGGFINTTVPGRTDEHNITVPPGSYVLTADVVSAIGEGNSVAGAKKLSAMFGPGSRYGSRLQIPAFAGGGAVESVPVQVAGGEYIIPPSIVRRIGEGDLDKGHDVLDKFQLKIRSNNIQRLKSLKPPKGADEK